MPSASHNTHDRGRSRIVSPAALARRASEERRRAATRNITHNSIRRPSAPVVTTVPRQPQPPKQNPMSRPSKRIGGQLTTPVVAQQRQSKPKQQQQQQQQFAYRSAPYTHPNFYVYGSSARVYKSPPRHHYFPRSTNSDSDFVQGSSSRRIDDGEPYTVARIPRHRLEEVEPESEPEPERRDEDLEDDGCYCEGRIVLDAETEAILQEGIRKLKEKEAMQEKERQMRQIQWMWEAESQKVRAAKMVLSSSQISLDSNPTITPSADNSYSQHPLYEPFSFVDDEPAGPIRVSFEEAWKSMRGSLFGDEEGELPTTTGSNGNSKSIELLNSLLRAKPEPAQPVHAQSQDTVADKDAAVTTTATATLTSTVAAIAAPVNENKKLLTAIATTGLGAWLNRANHGGSNNAPPPIVSSPTTTTTNCVACSMSTATTISRANSWMSTISGNTASTALTSPPTSPIPSKLNIPSLLLRESSDGPVRLVHSCGQYKNGRGKISLPLVPVQMSESPLHAGEYDRKVRADMARKAAGAAKQGSGLAWRLASSVMSAFDVAAKWHASSLRTLEFVVPRPASQYTSGAKRKYVSRAGVPTPKDAGYRVASQDLLTFIPSVATREIPDETFYRYLMPLHAGQSPKPRVFSPPNTPSPSPHRRHPDEPQIRWRPIANPVVLRLRALQNTLGKSGVRWEGRAYMGSLGYGAERVSGVAVDGIKGSALAYEVEVG